MLVNIQILTVLLAVVSPLMCQQIGTLTPESHPPITWQKCDKSAKCTTVHGGITMDANWRWLHDGDQKACLTNGQFEAKACPDPVTCAKNCYYEGITAAQYSTNYGVSTSGSTLSQIHAGSRLYFMANDSTHYEMFHLLGQEFTFDVDMSKLACGLNAALYLVSMEADGGAKHATNKAGAKYGMGYCDAQCPRGLPFVDGQSNPGQKTGVCCSEMDIWEANSMATVFTPHPCTPAAYYKCEGDACNGHCDSGGCGYNGYSQGNHNFYGPGKTVDSHKVMTVVTQFITSDGTANTPLQEIRRFYVQNGKVIPEATSTSTHKNSITTDFCASSAHGGLKQMGEALKAGMVLVASLWEDTQGGMLWLDSGNNGPCPSTFSHETQIPKSAVVWSNIKIGPINSTFHH